MNGLDLIRAASFPVKTNFSRLPNFLSHIKDSFINLPFDFEVVSKKLDSLILELEKPRSSLNEELIQKKLIARDLMLIHQSLIANRKLIEEDVDLEKSILNTIHRATKLLSDVGINFKVPKAFFVDKYPPPYDRATGSAMAIDAWDEKHYGISRGLYFKKSAISPIYSRFLVAHEIIHSYLGELSPEFMARGLEEGIAEILGAIYLGKQILGKEIVKNTFYHNRLGFGINQFWQLYLDYTRMCMYLYNRFGLHGLTSLIQQGRKRIKVIEGLCLTGEFSNIDLPSGGWDDDLTDIGSFLCMTYSRDFVVSPIAYYVANFIEEGDTVRELSLKCNLQIPMIEDALRELQDRVSVLVQNKGRVDITDIKMLLSSNAIRYEINQKAS